jgi:(E)-4-hydroxy-3-methylbut-2-enyl-diphosphate synthase
VVSLKSCDSLTTIQANEIIAKYCEYPLHLGVTASGPSSMGIIKSAIAIGRLLSEGIGDTIRVSLTDQATKEVTAALYILRALGLKQQGPQIISCPTCGRCEVDLISIVNDLEQRLSSIDFKQSTRPMKLAVMGCEVNGPGEAREADLGIAFGKKQGLLFKKGRAIRKLAAGECISTLLNELKAMGF